MACRCYSSCQNKLPHLHKRMNIYPILVCFSFPCLVTFEKQILRLGINACHYHQPDGTTGALQECLAEKRKMDLALIGGQ